jgi:cytoskeleton protein RodZ
MNSVETEVVTSAYSQEAVSPSAGAMLKAAREASGLHIAALAVSMKVPVKKLEALEANRFDQMPDAVFVRALAAGVCRALKIDATPIMELLPKSATPRLGGDDRGINAPFTVPNNSRGMVVPDFLAKPTVLAVIALMLGVLVLVFFPDSRTGSMKTDAEPVAISVAPAAGGIAAVVPPFPNTTEPAPVASAPVFQSIPNLPSASINEAGGQKLVEIGTPAAEVIVFKVRGTSWLEVKDAKGNVPLNTTLKAGESATASGAFPLSVVIGRADVTDVQVRGKPFPLDTITKDNVARFEVK